MKRELELIVPTNEEMEELRKNNLEEHESLLEHIIKKLAGWLKVQCRQMEYTEDEKELIYKIFCEMQESGKLSKIWERMVKKTFGEKERIYMGDKKSRDKLADTIIDIIDDFCEVMCTKLHKKALKRLIKESH